LADAYPAVTGFQASLATVSARMAIAMDFSLELPAITSRPVNADRVAEVVRLRRDVVARYRKLADSHADNVYLQIRLGYAHNNLGISLQRSGLLDEALEECGRGAAVFRALADAHPDEPTYRKELVFRAVYMSWVLRRMGRPAEALDLDRRLLALAEKLGERNADWLALSFVLRSLALSLRDLNDAAGAVAAARRAAALADKLGRDMANHCDEAAECHAILWTVGGMAGAGVSESERELAARTALALFHRAAEIGYVDLWEMSFLPEALLKRDDFQLLLMDVAMPHDPFAGEAIPLD
jgi:tetratricopeptide (TPR) repeat protein